MDVEKDKPENAFVRALAFTLKWEGGYVHHPADKGGATNMGVTEATARAHGYMGDMKALPANVAADIYNAIWTGCKASKLAELERPLTAVVLFDTAVNSGSTGAAKLLQGCLGLLLPISLTADGDIGPATLAACRDVQDATLARSLLSQRLGLLNSIVAKRPDQRVFLAGWLRRVFALAKEMGL